MKRVLLALFIGAVINSSVQAALPVAVEGQPLPTLAPMLERVQQSIVTVSASAQSQTRSRNDPFFNDPFFNRFFEKRRATPTRTSTVASTGVIIDAQNGFVLTNQHSIVGASKITINLADGREAQGQVIGSDKASDVAIIKIDLADLVAIDLGDSDALRVGDFVVSIGDPIGEHNTIASGIISALAVKSRIRNQPVSYQNFIQSDTGFGPGVLVNLRGELIGINISKVAQTAANNRIGFSTPVNVALKVKSQLVKYGSPQRGFLAVQVQDLTPDLANAFNIQTTKGVVVTSVTEGSSADTAGIRIGDVIVKAGPIDVNRGRDLNAIIGQHFSGDSLDLTMFRQGESMTLPVFLESSSKISSTGSMVHHRLQGATFKELDTRQVSTNAAQGVLVESVKQGSVAWTQGVRPNDLIVSANRKSVNNMASFKRAIANHDVLMLNIVRGNGALFLLLQ
jgi:serine protease Do/serine protease DegQ